MSDHIDHPTRKALVVLGIMAFFLVFIILWAFIYYHAHNQIIHYN